MCTLGAKDIIEDAISSFRERFPGLALDTLSQTTVNDVKHDILDLQLRQERQKSMLNFARLHTALSAFEQLANNVRLTQGQAGYIWGPIKNTLRIANENREILDPILNAYFELGNSVPRVVPHDDILKARPELLKALAFMYHDILTFQADVSATLTSGAELKRTFKSKWDDYASHAFRHLLKRFHQHHKLFEMQLESYEKETLDDLAYRMSGLVQDYREDREDSLRHIRQYEDDRIILLANARDAEEKRKNDQLEQILAWLSTPGVNEEQEEHHERFRQTRKDAERTCQWIFKNDHMLNWLNLETAPPNSILWLHGKMGCGKTILASSVIDRCMEYRPARRDTEIIETTPQLHTPTFRASYFYCQEEDSRQNDALIIYKSLLRQMLRHCHDLLPVCHEKRAKGQVTLNQEELAQTLLSHFVDADLNQFIIIDGIHACNPGTRRIVINFLSRLVTGCESSRPGKIRLLLVSRDPPGTGRPIALETEATTIEMTTKLVQKDIGLYLDAKVQKMEDFGLNSCDIERICRRIMKNSNGMFLYAQIVMENLLAQSTVGDVLDVLESSRFPIDLASAYSVIVDRLKKQLTTRTWQRARRIFGWLACGKRPLQWHEIQAGLVISHDKDTGELILDYYSGKLRNTVEDMCGSLVQVLKGRITFVHPTAREHILRNEELDEGVVECELAIACMSYLAGPCFQVAADPDRLSKYIDDKFYAFHDYAASKWNFHLEAVQRNGSVIFAIPHTGRSLERALTKAIMAFTNAFSLSFNPRPRTRAISSTSSGAGNVPDNEGLRERAEAACEAFREFSFYAPMLRIWTHLEFASAVVDGKQRNKISLSELGSSVTRIRAGMELKWLGLPPDSADRANFEKIYGPNVFKCDRTACDYFYMGFETQELRDSHTQRHDRPFLCPVEGCNIVKFGFTTNKDRDKHIRNYHPDDPANTGFGPVPRELTRGVRDNARFNCPHCLKSFTRKAIRDDHIRAHFGERPHQCSLCSKAFVRANDLRRHIAQIHGR